jgi:hypothetical protein
MKTTIIESGLELDDARVAALESEARRRGVTVDRLLQEVIEAKADGLIDAARAVTGEGTKAL